MKDENCIFCKLANGDIPTNTVYEDEEFRVILDASPATRGHALILPKQHYADSMKLAKKLAIHMKKVLGCDGVNVLQNNEETAGQTVFHFHVHVIPRYQGVKNDDIIQWTHEDFSENEMKKIFDTVKM